MIRIFIKVLFATIFLHCYFAFGTVNSIYFNTIHLLIRLYVVCNEFLSVLHSIRSLLLLPPEHCLRIPTCKLRRLCSASLVFGKSPPRMKKSFISNHSRLILPNRPSERCVIHHGSFHLHLGEERVVWVFFSPLLNRPFYFDYVLTSTCISRFLNISIWSTEWNNRGRWKLGYELTSDHETRLSGHGIPRPMEWHLLWSHENIGLLGFGQIIGKRVSGSQGIFVKISCAECGGAW